MRQIKNSVSSVFIVLIVVAATFLFAAIYTQIFADANQEQADPFEQIIEVLVEESKKNPGFFLAQYKSPTNGQNQVEGISANSLEKAQNTARIRIGNKFPGYTIIIKGKQVTEPPAEKPKPPKPEVRVDVKDDRIVVYLIRKEPIEILSKLIDKQCSIVGKYLARKGATKEEIEAVIKILKEEGICAKDDLQTSVALIDCPVDNKCWNWFLFYEESGSQSEGFNSQLASELSDYMRQNAPAGWTDYIGLWNFYDSNNPGKPRLPSYKPNKELVNYDHIDYTKTVLVVPIKEWIKVGRRNIGVGDFSKAISLKSADDFKKLNGILQTIENAGPCKKVRGQEPPAESNRPQKSDFLIGVYYTAGWCVPCQKLKGLLKDGDEKHEPFPDWRSYIIVVDVDDNKDKFTPHPSKIPHFKKGKIDKEKEKIEIESEFNPFNDYNALLRYLKAAERRYQEALRNWEREQRLGK